MSQQKTVLVLLPTFSQTIEQRICVGIHEVLSEQGVRVINAPLGYLPEQEDELLSYSWAQNRLSAIQPDAVLVYGGGLAYRSGPEILKKLLEPYGDIPIVNMGNRIEGLPSIEVDNYQGMVDMIQSIVNRRPDARYLFIAGPEGNEDSRLRFQALNDALSKVSRKIGPKDVLVGDFTPHVAYTLFNEYLETTETPADIIVCANDLTAKGVLDSMLEHNLKCPDDFWVTGFDDFEYAASIMPGLTTVHFPARDLGRVASQIALKAMAGESIEGTAEVVEGYPVMRGSTDDVHAGIGDYEQQLRDQWSLVHQRDNNARKLIVLRSVNRRSSLPEVLQGAKNSLADLQVTHLSVFVQHVHEDGQVYFEEFDLDSAKTHLEQTGVHLPSAFDRESQNEYWLFCPLELDEDHYGYLVARCSAISAEFVEFLAPQITELLHTEALESRNEAYRVQNELNERMVSLGSLVSGVAHEVNTPIGTGKLASSSMLDSLKRVGRLVEEGQLRKTDFEEFLQESEEYAQIIYQSLDRAAELISSFKMVSVDQTAEVNRRFDLGEYIGSVLVSLRHQLKGTKVSLIIDLEENIEVETSPGAVAQVITNMFMNSLKHGFKNGELEGTIQINLHRQARGFVLTIQDDGVGASEEVLNHIFDPFFTTTRGKGGSGLGMHIVFNLLTQKLNWTVQLSSESDHGFKAVIRPA